MSSQVCSGVRIFAYTSCSINYLPKARALSASLKRHHPDATLVLCLSDTVPAWLDFSKEPFDAIWLLKDLGFSDGWTFMHNVMEVCTAVKGRALVRALKEYEADLYFYLDPDVYVYAKLDPVVDYMSSAEIGLVPHITRPEETEIGVEMTELSVITHGTYNLGHLVLTKGAASTAFAKWWDERLTKYCYDEKDFGLFTDQRWCDLVPALFDKVQILRQPNLDVASWNIFGRVINHAPKGSSSPYIVDGYPLLTYHFSGTGPTGTHRRVREIFASGSGAVAEIERDYEEAIAGQGQAEFANLSYGGDFYYDGKRIFPVARRLYRKNKDLQAAFPNPYRTGGSYSYFDWLSENRPAALASVVLSPRQIEQAFSELFDEKFYLDQYPDVWAAIENGKFTSAMDHYIRVGSKLLYDPSALFVSSYYFEKTHKVEGLPIRKTAPATRENTLLWHYLTTGLPAGLEPIEHFNSSEYLARYSDIELQFRLGNVSSPLSHFSLWGDKERRQLTEVLDLEAFVANSVDAAALMDRLSIGPFAAFALLGFVEGRVGIVSARW